MLRLIIYAFLVFSSVVKARLANDKFSRIGWYICSVFFGVCAVIDLVKIHMLDL